VSPDGKTAFASCGDTHQVVVIDLEHWKIERVIEAGDGADGLAWAK
jgi:hypothetical protein